ncbi:hypothetical protein NQ318_011410 [Aromia moschata]|uniref:Uncharacterized protein n=1 Tax=Aromia moschata TaxID=1265417 RepID=A0AAV8YVM3_9CUCU|nr:hypothetical protein NQ318_011410 [Aromia moschata]
MKWFCEGCLSDVDLINKISSDLESLKTFFQSEIKDLKDMFRTNTDKRNETKLGLSKTYAEAVSEEVVIIKPKTNQECKKTKEANQKNIKPGNLEVGMAEMRNIKEGGVVIKCKTKEEKEIIKKAAEKKLNKNYEIKIPNLKNPCVKIVDIEDEYEPDDLLNLIKKQNISIFHENSVLQVKVIKKMKTKFMAIIECDPDSFKKIMDQNAIFIDWAKCRVFEYYVK